MNAWLLVQPGTFVCCGPPRFWPVKAVAHQLMREDELGTNTRPESHPFIISDKNMVSKPQL